VTPQLETRRLLLRPIELADAAQVQALFPQWEIVKYLAKAVPWPYPPDGVLAYYRDVAIPAMEHNEAWHWTLRLKESPAQIIGSISLLSGKKNRGFWITPEWQGRGLMTEACDTVTDFWFNVLKMPVLRVPKAIVNAASRRISEKQGMRVIATGEQEYVSGRYSTETWEITAEEWGARKRGEQTEGV